MSERLVVVAVAIVVDESFGCTAPLERRVRIAVAVTIVVLIEQRLDLFVFQTIAVVVDSVADFLCSRMRSSQIVVAIRVVVHVVALTIAAEHCVEFGIAVAVAVMIEPPGLRRLVHSSVAIVVHVVADLVCVGMDVCIVVVAVVGISDVVAGLLTNGNFRLHVTVAVAVAVVVVLTRTTHLVVGVVAVGPRAHTVAVAIGAGLGIRNCDVLIVVVGGCCLACRETQTHQDGAKRPHHVRHDFSSFLNDLELPRRSS